MTPKCRICGKTLDEHETLAEVQLCYFKSKLETQLNEEVK